MAYIVVQYYQFPIREPFEAGHVITEVEANILNWHRAGLIQKTVQRWVMEAADGSDDILPLEELDKLAWRIKEFDDTYEMGMRRPPKKSILEYNLELVANGLLLQKGEWEPTEEDIERVKRTPEVQSRARDMIRSATFTPEELLT